ncbi:hypothetical protein LNP25_30225 [Klebsiella variicola subsp. variicola]|nr:hypothetical protein [Klebsiella variicola subsp. variicola]
MLKFGTMSPVGNLRIKDSVPDWDSLASSKTFSVTDVMNRASDFLDYAQNEEPQQEGATLSLSLVAAI